MENALASLSSSLHPKLSNTAIQRSHEPRRCRFRESPTTSPVITVVTDTLLNFLLTGELGDLRTAMTRDAVRTVLGEPDEIATTADIWLFGDQGNTNLQLSFVDDRVHGIWLYFWGSTDTTSIPDCLNASSWTINGQTSIDQLTDQLTVCSAQWRMHEPLSFDGQTCILVESNVHCLWSYDNESTLEKIMLTDGSNEWSPAT